MTRAGTITIAIAEDGSAMLVCSGCGTLRRAMPEQVAARVGALAKAHAALHSTAAAQGYDFGSVAHLLSAAGGLSPEDRS